MFILEMLRDVLFALLFVIFSFGFLALLMPRTAFALLKFVRYRVDSKKEEMTPEEAQKYESNFGAMIGYLILAFIVILLAAGILDKIVS